MAKKIIIFDTTLRDGEQAPGAKMSMQEKILVAKNLDGMGVDVIEAGFAASSDGEFETLSQISKILEKSTICSLARAKKEDILTTYNALKNASKKRLHTFISTSEIHIKHKLGKTHDEVLEMIKVSVAFAKTLFDDVEWSAEDATRTDYDFLARCVSVAIENGAKTINIPDTVGYFTPFEYSELFKKLTAEFRSKDVIFSCHCHDDLGMASANSIAAIMGGAGQVECTINGIGERAGNCAMEEVVMAIKTRKDLLNYATSIDTRQFVKISELVSNVTGFFVQANKAIIGKNAFSHESGIHQDGMLKNRQTYEIMTPEDVGFEKTTLTLGKLSGRNALNDKLKQLNFNLSKEELDAVFIKFKALCDIKKTIYDSDIISLLTSKTDESSDEILSYSVNSLENGDKQVSVVAKIGGVEIQETQVSSGILNASLKCINEILKINPSLEKYELKAISMDADAQGIASVVVKNGEKIEHGSGCNCDIIMASIIAYFSACLKIK
ncbi:2-isopropylmalate synthase [Candidatus Deianiraea vastatrix]|uniref:2-isopropylmalate synthase n=1 Tax=Candidatus Deianiraea vastatrix TaxID=2163644 RepID=A0A5B8XHD1_9RICK|nr:2-isopropylmalate synthase [Candidatus Deianiraea vastatrix]QED23237.1 2-isopropylmalate synthase [Candidatus Deianiraea vastatrix]